MLQLLKSQAVKVRNKKDATRMRAYLEKIRGHLK